MLRPTLLQTIEMFRKQKMPSDEREETDKRKFAL